MSTPAIPRGPSRGAQLSLAQIAFGVFLVLLGLGWLLDATGVLSVSWGAALPIALIGIGALLVLGSATPHHGGLVFLGVALTVVLAVSTLIDVPLNGQSGNFETHPTTFADVHSDYQWSLGNQTIDLSNVALPGGTTRVSASVGVGDLVVQVPAGVGVSIHYKVGLGNANLFGRDTSGASLDETYVSSGYADATQKLQLELSMGIGSIEVR